MTIDKSREHAESMANPLAQPSPWWRELYQRIKLFPWWIKYNVGLTEESNLKDKIVDLASEMNLDKSWTKKILRHAISEFSKKGLGLDYYGYHNIDHELEATYFSLLSAYGHIMQNSEVDGLFNNEGIKYLFLSALFHDYDPAKQFDKPNEESVEWFLRNDPEIRKFIDLVGLDINVIVAVIYRTAYPFKGSIAENATKRIHELLSIKSQVTGGNANEGVNRDSKRIEHYKRLGWFLSVCERMAGYALGDFEHANKLARSNAHALGWHPSVINEESVKYFDALKQEGEMMQFVLKGIPENLRKSFFDNIEAFENLYEEEKKIRALTGRKEISFECRVEKIGHGHDEDRISGLDPAVRDCVLNIYNKLPIPLKRGERHFIKSLSSPDTIIITLRIKKEPKPNQQHNEKRRENESKIPVGPGVKEGEEYGGSGLGNDDIVGYVKGGPLEKYGLRRGTLDENYGERNTAYMEWICIKPGYWGSAGGHLLRMNFLMEAKERGYDFLTGYVHRNVISTRKSKGEIIQIVQKYDPDKLDYYRIDLSKITITDILEEDSEFATAVYP